MTLDSQDSQLRVASDTSREYSRVASQNEYSFHLRVLASNEYLRVLERVLKCSLPRGWYCIGSHIGSRNSSAFCAFIYHNIIQNVQKTQLYL